MDVARVMGDSNLYLINNAATLPCFLYLPNFDNTSIFCPPFSVYINLKSVYIK